MYSKAQKILGIIMLTGMFTAVAYQHNKERSDLLNGHEKIEIKKNDPHAGFGYSPEKTVEIDSSLIKQSTPTPE